MLYCGWCPSDATCRLVTSCPTFNNRTFNGTSACRLWDENEWYCNNFVFDQIYFMWNSWRTQASYAAPGSVHCGYCFATSQCVGTTSPDPLANLTCGNQTMQSICNRWGPASCNGQIFCTKSGTWSIYAGCNSFCGIQPCVSCAWCKSTSMCIDISATAATQCSSLAQDACSALQMTNSLGEFAVECATMSFCSLPAGWFDSSTSCARHCNRTCIQCALCNSTNTCINPRTASSANCPGWTSDCSAFDSLLSRCSNNIYCAGNVSTASSECACARCADRCLPLSLAATCLAQHSIDGCSIVTGAGLCNSLYSASDGTHYYPSCPPGLPYCWACGWCNSTSTCMWLNSMNSSTCPGWTSNCSIYDNRDDQYGCQTEAKRLCTSSPNCERCRWCASSASCMPSTTVNAFSCPNWSSNCSTWSNSAQCNVNKYCPLSGVWISGSEASCNIRGERATGCLWCGRLGQCLLNTTIASDCPNYTSPCNSLSDSLLGSCNEAGEPFYCPTSLGGFCSYAKFGDCYRCGQCNSSLSSKCQPFSSLSSTCAVFTGPCSVYDGDQLNCNTRTFCMSSIQFYGSCSVCTGSCQVCYYCASTGKCLTGRAAAQSSLCPTLADSLCSAWNNASSTNGCNFFSFCPDVGWIDSTLCYSTCFSTCLVCGACLPSRKCLPVSQLNASTCPGYIDRCSSLDEIMCDAPLPFVTGSGAGYCNSTGALTIDDTSPGSTTDFSCANCPGECFRCMFCHKTNMCLSGASWFDGKCDGSDPCSYFLGDARSCSLYKLTPIGDWSSTCIADYTSPHCISCHFCGGPTMYLGTCRGVNTSCYTHSSSKTTDESRSLPTYSASTSRNASVTSSRRVSHSKESMSFTGTRSMSMSKSRLSQTLFQSSSTSRSLSPTAASRTASASSRSISISESCLAKLQVLNSPLLIVGPYSGASMMSTHELDSPLPTADLISSGIFSVNTSATSGVVLLDVGNASSNVGRVVNVSLNEKESSVLMQFELKGSDVGKVSFVNKMQMRIEVRVAATGRCVPPEYIGTLSFEWSLTPFPPRTALQRATTVVFQSSTTSSSVLGNPVTAMTTTSMISMSSLSECLFSDVDPLDPSVSPTGAALGDSLGQYYRGGALVAISLYVGVTSIATIAGLVYSTSSPTRSVFQAFAFLRFPSRGMMVVGVFHQGLVTCSTSLIRLGGVGDFDLLLGFVSLGVSALLVVGALYITTSTRLQCRLEDVSQAKGNQSVGSYEEEVKEKRSQSADGGEDSSITRPAIINHHQLSSRFTQRFMRVVVWQQHWRDTSGAALYKPRYMMLIDDLRLPWWTSVELSSGLIQGVILGIRQNSLDVCRSQQFALTAHCFILFAAASFFRPCGATLSNVFLVLSKFFSLVISLFTLLHTATLDDSMKDAAQIATTTATMLSSLQTAIQLVVMALFAAPALARFGTSASGIAAKWLRSPGGHREEDDARNRTADLMIPPGESFLLSVPVIIADQHRPTMGNFEKSEEASDDGDEMDFLLLNSRTRNDDADAYLRLLGLDSFGITNRFDNSDAPLLRAVEERRRQDADEAAVAGPPSSVEMQKAQLFKELQIGYVPPVLKQSSSSPLRGTQPPRALPRNSRQRKSQPEQKSADHNSADDDDDDNDCLL